MVMGMGASQAGGTWLEPSDIRVEAGERVQLEATVDRGTLGWVDDGPFFLYLQGENYGAVIDEGYGGATTDVPLGPLELGPRIENLEVSAEILIPDGVPPGEYWVTVCNDPCTIGLGDLIGGLFYVGIDPPADETAFVPVTDAPTTAAATTATTTSTVAPPYQRMALAPYPERPVAMSPLWIGISAAFAGAVLLAALATRQRG